MTSLVLDRRPCKKCNRLLTTGDFYPSRAIKGKTYQRSYCKECSAKSVAEFKKRNRHKLGFRRKHAQAQRKYSKSNYHKIIAHRCTQRQKIEHQCGVCGTSLTLERHHPDYSKPYMFWTLCKRCHMGEHKK